MYIIFTYLIGILISIFLFNPKNRFGLWRGVLMIPIIITVWYILHFLNESNNGSEYIMYSFGSKIAKCILPFLISSAINYYYLNKKMKNGENFKFSIGKSVGFQKIRYLTQKEVIIFSIVIGTIIFLILGYFFGETQVLRDSYQIGTDYDRNTKSNVPRYSYNQVKTFHFNYILAIAGFIISSGISYLILTYRKHER